MDLRRKLRTMRRDIPATHRARLDQAIRQNLSQLVRSRAVSSMAAYWPFDGEPDIVPLCREWLGQGIGVALPKISATGNGMEFRTWNPDLALGQNRFGIPEPLNTEIKLLSEFDLLIIPLVGYDRFGNRLGVGSGYYDRYLEPLRNSPSPLRVGIAYGLQETGLIDHNDWDIHLHGVVNENGSFTFDR